MTAFTNEIDSQRLLRLTEEVTRIAGSLAELSTGRHAFRSEGQIQGPAVAIQESADISPEAVRWLIAVRRERSRYFTSDLFADPAWDILLDLLLAELSKRRVAVSSLCIAAGVPTSTGLRWISNMVKQGLLVRQPDRHDGRRVYIELVPEVSEALRRYFIDVVQPRRLAS